MSAITKRLQKRFDNRRLVFQAHITEILGLKVVRNSSVPSLRELSDKFNAHIRALKGLGTTEQIAGCIIVQVLLQKLDAASQAKWEERLEDPVFANLIPSWESMAAFLEQRCRTWRPWIAPWQPMRQAFRWAEIVRR